MIGSIGLPSSLATSQSRLLTALEQLSSANSINSAADNPAGMAQSASFSVQLSSSAQAMNNVQNGGSLLDTAAGAIDQITQGMQDIRSLVVQAGNGALSASDLQSIQSQISQISQGIDQIASNTQFNGQNLLDGSLNLSVQAGANAGQTQGLSLGSFSTASLGLSNLDITTQSGQANAISTLDTAMQQVNGQQATIGAAQTSLNSSLSNLNATYENLAAAKSRVSDTDYAKASSDLAQANVKQQSSLQALAMYNAMQNNVLTLLPK